MPYEIYTGGAIKRRTDGTFSKKGADNFLGQQSTIEGAREQIMDSSHYIKYTGDELRNFVPGHIPVEMKQSRGRTLINLDQNYFGHLKRT